MISQFTVKGKAVYLSAQLICGVLPNINGKGSLVYSTSPIEALEVDEEADEAVERWLAAFGGSPPSSPSSQKTRRRTSHVLSLLHGGRCDEVI